MTHIRMIWRRIDDVVDESLCRGIVPVHQPVGPFELIALVVRWIEIERDSNPCSINLDARYADIGLYKSVIAIQPLTYCF